jgi:squalene-hopene/tetraprenyl-beta-curcumene cyclase
MSRFHPTSGESQAKSAWETAQGWAKLPSMNKGLQFVTAAMILSLTAAGHAAGADQAKTPVKAGWDAAAAALYLDARESWWQGWDRAKRDHGTRCVSCHTQATYAFARPALRTSIGALTLTKEETAMLADVRKRVQAWSQMLPFYSDEVYGKGKEIESRNAEAVLNAIILSNYDIDTGEQNDVTVQAFRHAWELQTKTGPDAGAWVWQNFEYAPWESKESQYHWAALMAVQAAREPGSYTGQQDVQEPLKALRSYLKTHYEAQPLLNKIAALWASGSFAGILNAQQKESLLSRVYSLQRADGGWSATDLGDWHRRDGTPLETRSDGYATALIGLVLEEAIADSPDPPAQAAARIERALAWLRANQNPETGAWPAWSLNKNRDLGSGTGKFMSDAATAYASLALLGWPRHVVYRNARYGFCVDLPARWAGYEVIEEKWESGPASGGAPASGLKLRFRSPRWTKDAPREDIPILVFTTAQWRRVQKEKLIVSAAPIGPQALAQSERYVFALPPRWNYDSLPGLDDANRIVAGKPLRATCESGAR